MHQIELKNVSKTLKGHQVLNDVTFSLDSGMVYGLIGKNGSGKTMVLRALAGLLIPDKGHILLNNEQMYRAAGSHRLKIGIMLENANLYPQLTCLENLRILASIRSETSEEKIRDSILQVGLDPEDRRPYRKYSLGMKQRLLVAQAIMEEPDLLLLDEPTSALDDNGARLIRNIIREEADRGAVVVLASHSHEDLEQCSDSMFRVTDGSVSIINIEDKAGAK